MVGFQRRRTSAFLFARKIKSILSIFEEISTDILNNVSGNNIEYVKSHRKARCIYICTIGLENIIEMASVML